MAGQVVLMAHFRHRGDVSHRTSKRHCSNAAAAGLNHGAVLAAARQNFRWQLIPDASSERQSASPWRRFRRCRTIVFLRWVFESQTGYGPRDRELKGSECVF